MATRKQTAAAQRNIVKAQQAARASRSLAHLPAQTRHELAVQAAKGRRRGGAPGHALEERNRSQLYELAKQRGITGRSRMGKWELIEALRDR